MSEWQHVSPSQIVLSDIEDPENDHIQAATPPPIARKGQKRPYAREPSPDPDDQPDLAAYFSQWVISPKEQILMCRAYASYLSVQGKLRQAK